MGHEHAIRVDGERLTALAHVDARDQLVDQRQVQLGYDHPTVLGAVREREKRFGAVPKRDRAVVRAARFWAGEQVVGRTVGRPIDHIRCHS
jgi:hypothetical protein